MDVLVPPPASKIGVISFQKWYTENLVGLNEIYEMYKSYKTEESKESLDWDEFVKFMYSKSV